MGPIRYVRFKLRQMARFHQLTLRTGRLPRHKCLWGIPDNSPVLALGSFTHCLRPPRNDNINKKHPTGGYFFIYLVALVGLEPTLIAELDFESSASTNSATGPSHQKLQLLCSFLCFNFLYQACTAIRLVCRFLGGFFRFANFLFNSLFNSGHFVSQA